MADLVCRFLTGLVILSLLLGLGPGVPTTSAQPESHFSPGRSDVRGAGSDPVSSSAATQSDGITTRVSVASDGSEGNGLAELPSISADGRYVAFRSYASNLVSDDTNNYCDTDDDGQYDDNCPDTFVRDRETGQTTRVSVASDGTQGNGSSYSPSISAGGRYVAFRSYASNLVSDDTNGVADVFVRDRETGQTARASVASDTSQGNGTSRSPSISADGRYVAFESSANNLVSGDTNGVPDIFVRDREMGQTTRVSVASDGTQGNGASHWASISADARYVAFWSDATNLVGGDTNGAMDIFVHDRQTGETTRVSIAFDSAQGNSDSYLPSISADGRYVAFGSRATNLVSGDTNGLQDVFAHDRETGQTTLVSVASDGTQGNGGSYGIRSFISADGRYVTFESDATNLVSGDTNGVNDAFVHDRETGETTRVSVASDGSQGNDGSYFGPSISADGRYVAFDSRATNLVSDDTNGVLDVFVRDRGSTGMFSISGQVINASGTGIPEVTVSTGTAGSATTDAYGAYTVSGLITGTYTVVPTKPGYVFAPTSRAVPVPPSAVGASFIALAESDFVDADQSSLLASPLFLEADGLASSTVTIMLRNAAGAPVSGKEVHLVSDRGGADIITQPSLPTDASGMTTGEVRSAVSGTTTLWAWVLGDGIRVNQSVTLTFEQVAPGPDAVREEAARTVDLSDRTLDTMWENIQAIVDEAIYFWGAVGEDSIELAADFLGGLIDAWGNWSDWRNGVPASRYTFPGWEIVLDSPAWASPAACKISSAFLQDVTEQFEDEGLERLTRITLRGGLYFLTAQKDNTCLRDLQGDLLVDGSHIMNLIVTHLEPPVDEWPIKGVIDESRSFQQSELERVYEARLPPLSQEEIDAYIADLRARSNASYVLNNRLQDARWTLESVHSANETEGVVDDTFQTVLRLIAKGMADYAFDGAGRLLVGGVLTAFDTYMNTNALSESIQMAGLANGSIAKTAPEAVATLRDTTAVGLTRIVRGETPHTPEGVVTNVEHFSEGFYWGGIFWKEESSYSMVTIYNNGNHPARFHVVSRYLARTTRLGVPWATLWMSSESTPVEVDPGESLTVRVDYRTESRGYSPDEGQLVGNILPSPINIELMAANDESLFGLDYDYSDWTPTRVLASSESMLAAATAQDTTMRTIDEPLVVFAGGMQGQPHQMGYLWANNPFTTSVPVTVTQPIPLGVTPLDMGTGTMDGGDLMWTGWTPPLSSEMFTYTFGVDTSPGITITLPPATLAMVSPEHGVLTDTSTAPPFKVPWAVDLSRRTPDWIAPGSSATVVVTATNQLSVPVDGSLTLTVTDASQSPVFVGDRSFTLDGKESQTLLFELPGTLDIGGYRAIGMLASQGGSEVMFSDSFRVGARPPTVRTTAFPVASDGTVEPGSTLTYSTWVTNSADIPLTEVVISTTVPADTSILPDTVSDSGTVGEGVVRWEVDTLPVAEGIVRTFVIQIPSDFVAEGEGRYIESGAVLTSRESPRTVGQSSTVLVIHPERHVYLPVVLRGY